MPEPYACVERTIYLQLRRVAYYLWTNQKLILHLNICFSLKCIKSIFCFKLVCRLSRHIARSLTAILPMFVLLLVTMVFFAIFGKWEEMVSHAGRAQWWRQEAGSHRSMNQRVWLYQLRFVNVLMM